MKAKEITLAGMMTALSIMILYLASFIPISTISILTVVSSIIPIVIIKSNVKIGFFVYIASSILSFFIVPIDLGVLYFLFFGIYGIVKFFIERINKKYIELILKCTFFNIMFFIGYVIFEKVLGISVTQGIETTIMQMFNSVSKSQILIAFFLSVNIVFFIYDYALTLIITYFLKRFHK